MTSISPQKLPQIICIINFSPGPRGETAASGLPGMEAVDEGVCCTSVTPVKGILWEAGAAAAAAGLLGELAGREDVGVTPGEVAAVAAGMSYFCSCSR